jgi:hypothetical protein
MPIFHDPLWVTAIDEFWTWTGRLPVDPIGTQLSVEKSQNVKRWR